MEIMVWVAAFIILVVLEISTFQLVTIWFAAGSIAAFIAALFKAPIEVQLILFLCVSFLCLLLVRPFASRMMKKDTVKTNADSLVGETAVITADITGENSLGKASIRGQEWTAAAEDPAEHFKAGEKVTVSAIRGVKLIVKRRV